MKILFLPHCLNPELSEKIRDNATSKGYNIHIVGGSSEVEKILEKESNIEEIVGVACKKELKLASEYTESLKYKGVIRKSIELTTDGCKDTEVNLDEVLRTLE